LGEVGEHGTVPTPDSVLQVVAGSCRYCARLQLEMRLTLAHLGSRR
jgi:hypothetical protein